MLKTTITGVILITLVFEHTPEMNFYTLIGLLIGLSIRFTFNWSNGTITFKNCIIRLIYAVSISYLVLSVWKDFKIDRNPVYMIAAVGILSSEIVNEGIKILELGLKGYIKNWLNKLIAKDDRI